VEQLRAGCSTLLAHDFTDGIVLLFVSPVLPEYQVPALIFLRFQSRTHWIPVCSQWHQPGWEIRPEASHTCCERLKKSLKDTALSNKKHQESKEEQEIFDAMITKK